MDKSLTQIKITQIKSQIKKPERQKRTLKALGLGKIGKSNTLAVTPAVQGMLRQVQHLINQQIISS